MIQKPIRSFDGVTYTLEEGSEMIDELNARTKSARPGLNSVDELAQRVEALLNTGQYRGHYTTLTNLVQAVPTPRNGDRALVGVPGEGIFEYKALNGVWHSELTLEKFGELKARVEAIEEELTLPDWAAEAEDALNF